MDYGRAYCELKMYYCANDEEELKGWGLGECPLLLPYDNVSDDDLSDG